MITLAIHGTDARDMERIAAIPLEDALSGIPGMSRILTYSEDSRVRAFINFHKNAGDCYDAIREAAQKVYETLPQWAQRPILSSSDESRIPVWTAAIIGTPNGDYLEKVIKPALEGLDGVGEVEIAGSGINEIIIALDPEKIADLGLNPGQIAMSISLNDGKFHGGKLKLLWREFLIRVDGTYKDSSSLSDAFITAHPGKRIRLKDISSVYEQKREEDVLSRLDGENTAVIYIQAASGTDLRRLSFDIKKELQKFDNGFEFKILRDSGAEEEKAYRSALTATAFAAILVALCAILLTRKYRSGWFPALASALSIPFIAILSAALLTLFGFPINRKLLAGLSIGIGAAADAVILCANGFGKGCTSGDEGKIVSKILPPLIAGGITTIAALFPLARFSEADEMASIAWALGTVTLVSLVVSISVLPPLFLGSITRKNLVMKSKTVLQVRENRTPVLIKHTKKYLSGNGKRILGAGIYIGIHKPFVFPAFAIVLTLLGIGALFFSGVDVSENDSGNSIYTRIEFEGGFHREEGDRLMAAWAKDLTEIEGIVSVQTSTRTGSAQAIINFDPAVITDGMARNLIRSASIPGGFIFIPETAVGEHSWEISIYGDDDTQCRRLAEEAASLCSALPAAKDTVLNFKPGNPRLILIPDRDRLAEEGLWFSDGADIVRRAIHGPVVYKRPGEKGETDVRLIISNTHQAAPDDILTLPIISSDRKSNQGISKINSLFTEIRDYEPSMIKRENRRRTASFSVRTASMDPRNAKKIIIEATRDIELPPGYTIEFDRDAIKKAEALSGTVFLFILALTFCYIVIAAVNESFILPFAILSAVPPSLAVPVLALVILRTPINSAICCSLIAVSGITINAAVIVAGEFASMVKNKTPCTQISAYRIIRKCLPCLFAVCGTTMAGALPFLFLRDISNLLISTLAMVTFWGVIASFIISITLIPSLILRFNLPRN